MNFLPDGFEKLKTQKNYWKMSEMKEGDNKLRIVAKPIAGWLDWQDKKPLRYRPDKKPKKPVDAEKPIKAFWSCYVWDYSRESLFILEITQNSIMKSLTSFAKDEDWGDFTQYDLKLHKEGSGKDTRYSITPLPHKDLSDKIKDALATTPVRLEALYDGGDPWDINAEDEYGEVETQVTDIDGLSDMLKNDGVSLEILDDYLNFIAKSKGKSVEDVARSACIPEVYPSFKAQYVKEVAKKTTSKEGLVA